MSDANIQFIMTLEKIIQQRIASDDQSSYTARLVNAGTKRVAQKVGEEGIEVALAALAGDRNEVISEAADLTYHLLVLLNEQDISITDVATELESRHDC